MAHSDKGRRQLARPPPTVRAPPDRPVTSPTALVARRPRKVFVPAQRAVPRGLTAVAGPMMETNGGQKEM